MSDLPKLLWHANSPLSPTGYGQQSGLFVPRLAEHYNIAASANYGQDGYPIKWNGVPILPGFSSDPGNISLPFHARHWFDGDPAGGLTVALMDVWPFDPGIARQLRLACWVPVDHQPAPPSVEQFFIRSGAVPIAMSRFGERMLGRLDPLYVPHGIDTTIYRPHPKKETRELVGLPEDAFLVGMVAANKGRPSRKGFSQAFQAFAEFQSRHENAFLYLHTTISPQYGEGEDLTALIEALGVPADSVLTSDQYRLMFNPHPSESMAQIYSTMDVLLNPAMGEGFGITPLEAQACGTPCIVTNFSAMTEVCGAGWKVGHTPYWTGLKSWQATANVPEIVQSLEAAYSLTDEQANDLSEKARKHALGYDIEGVLEQYMLPALKTAEARFAKQDPVSIAPRLKAAA